MNRRIAPLATLTALTTVAALGLTACSSDDDTGTTADAAIAAGGQPAGGGTSGGAGGTGGQPAGGSGGTPVGGAGGTPVGGAGGSGGEVVADAGVPDAATPDAAAPACGAPPACVDQMILDLSLHADKVSEGAVTTTRDGDDFLTVVDATAGGFGQSDNNPWVYVKFRANGATRVDIDDETALESVDWDMSLRRFIVRLNGGDSGPSCVGAVSLLERTYEQIDTVPEGLDYLVDDYYPDDCTIVNDSSGLPGSPQVVLAPWWSYPGCVATTSMPHLIRLANGTVIKLVVDQYYEDATAQATCNAEGMAPPGAVSAVFTLRWRPMP
jgi:hypothetical protein